MKASRDGYINSDIPKCFLSEKDIKTVDKGTAITRGWGNLHKECNDLIKKLKSSDPLSIDFFLNKNPNLTKISKILIGWVLLECEENYKNSTYNPNRPYTADRQHKKEDNWVRYLIPNIIKNADITQTKVDFITFNYDLSLESKLSEALKNTETVKQADINSFFEDRIHHVYGQLKKVENLNNIFVNFKQDSNRYLGSLIDAAYEASLGLEIIAPKNNNDLSDIKRKIKNAQSLYILGYGFDDMNNSNLDLSRSLNHRRCEDLHRQIFFTNMGDKNYLNKKLGYLFLEDINAFMPNQPFIKGNGNNGYYYEKSIKSVYDALTEDFYS